MDFLNLRGRESEERENLRDFEGIEREECGGFLVAVKSEGKEIKEVESATAETLKRGVVAAADIIRDNRKEGFRRRRESRG